MSQSIARTLLEELRTNESIRRELALELASEIVKHRNARLVLTQAILREVATKDDIESLRKEFREELREKIGALENRVKALEDRVNVLSESVSRIESAQTLFTRLFIAFNIPILIGIIGTLLTIIWKSIP